MPFARLAQNLRERERGEVLKLVDVERVVAAVCFCHFGTRLGRLRERGNQECAKQARRLFAKAGEIAHHHRPHIDDLTDVDRRSLLPEDEAKGERVSSDLSAPSKRDGSSPRPERSHTITVPISMILRMLIVEVFCPRTRRRGSASAPI